MGDKEYFIMGDKLYYTYKGWKGFLEASREELNEYVKSRSYFKDGI